MSTISTKLASDLGSPCGGPTLRLAADSVADRSARWQLALDSAWRRKLDEAIALSKASCGLTSDADDCPSNPGVRASRRLQARAERAFDELAAIEDAIARLEGGTYGMCESCHQAMSDAWLADKPEVRYCPDCSLRRVSWPRPRLSICPS